jgi:hypothetical protein
MSTIRCSCPFFHSPYTIERDRERRIARTIRNRSIFWETANSNSDETALKVGSSASVPIIYSEVHAWIRFSDLSSPTPNSRLFTYVLCGASEPPAQATNRYSRLVQAIRAKSISLQVARDFAPKQLHLFCIPGKPVPERISNAEHFDFALGQKLATDLLVG